MVPRNKSVFLFSLFIFFTQAKVIVARRKGKNRPAPPPKKIIIKKKCSDQEKERLKKAAYAAYDQKDWKLAAVYFEKIIPLAEDDQRKVIYMCDAAYCYEKLGSTKKAYAIYKDCIELCLEDTLRERVLCKIIFCGKRLCPDCEHDQTQVRDLLQLIEQYLSNQTYQLHREELEAMKVECYIKVFDHFAYLVMFHADAGRYHCSQEVMHHMKNELQEQIPDFADRFSKVHEQFQQKKTGEKKRGMLNRRRKRSKCSLEKNE